METVSEYRWTVYGIQCPLSFEIRYVGVTCDLKERRRDHRKKARRGSHLRVHRWIRSMEDDGWDVEFCVLEQGVGYEEAAKAERKWIEICRCNGLLNVHEGGGFVDNLAAFRANRSDEARARGKQAGTRGAIEQVWKPGMSQAKGVRCVQTGKEWSSMRALAGELGVSESRVYQSCKKGFGLLGKHYIFADDEMYPDGLPRLSKLRNVSDADLTPHPVAKSEGGGAV